MKAGFYYSGEGDKVICPWCNLNLTEWESYDIPMEEHQRHLPYCAFVLMLCPFLNYHLLYLFIYLGFYVAFNTVQVISRRVVGRAEETST